jgi:uncharacterized membrane protein YfcA
VPRRATLAAIGLAAGLLASFFGVGGGTVIVPGLVAAGLMGLRPATATSLAAIGATAVFGALRYAADGRVHWADAALVGVPAMFGAAAGTSLQRRLRVRPLQLGFALVVAATGVRLVVG